jgi:uncharacterized protein YkwD
MKRFLTLIALVVLMMPTALAFDFSDVSDNYEYKNGINYLYDNEVVEGYEDGSFQPTKSINRAELAKIVVESVGLDLIAANSCFPDVPNDQWYATYVCTAKAAGWIEGYEDGTFQPSQNINRAEAIKIVAEAEDWDLVVSFDAPFLDTPLDQWYTKYVYFAKEKNFLPFNYNFRPGQSTKRGEFSEVYYRVLYSRDNDLEDFVDPNVDEEDEVVIEEPEDASIDIADTVEVDLGSLSYDSEVFDSIRLDSDFPKTFFEDEVYRFEGEVTSGNYDSLFIFSYPEDDSSDIQTFSGPVTNDRFSISMYFDEKDDYVIGIIPGTSGTSRIARISVEDISASVSTVDKPSAPSVVSVDFDSQYTLANYAANGAISRIIFTQGGDSVTYLSRQSGNSLALRYSDFEGFNEGSVNWKVEAANTDETSPFSVLSDWSSSSTSAISVVQHYFSDIKDTITLDSLPNFHSTGQSISLSGMTTADLSSTLYAIKPDGLVFSSKNENSYNAGDSFDFSYTFNDAGTHILEINDTKGLAVLNHPVYQSGKIPLIPDYFDIYKLELEPAKSFSGSSESSSMLTLVNAARRNFGFGEVSMDNDLSDLALDHALDMKNRGYFAHVNLSGETPNDRRVDAGIETIVGENIAKTVSTRFAFEALMRSAVHRANILDPYWTKVGIGTARNSSGYFYVVQEFSFDSSDLLEDFSTGFNDGRSSDLSINAYLTQASEEWLDIMIEGDFFATSNNGDRLFDHLQDGHGLTELKALILSGGNVGDMVELGFENSDIEDSKWTDVGFASFVSDDGGISLVVVYAR